MMRGPCTQVSCVVCPDEVKDYNSPLALNNSHAFKNFNQTDQTN